MKHKILFSTLFFAFTLASAQDVAGKVPPAVTDSLPFRGTFYCEEQGITLRLDLYGDGLDVPDYPFLGKTGGYMTGDTQERLYGTWFLLSHKINANKAVLRMSNDIGSDAQTIEFTSLPDGTFAYRATGGNEVKRAVRRKLYKVVAEMVFRRK